MTRTIVVTLIWFCAAISIVAQKTDERDQLRMAAAYERGGDMRGAARIYQDLYAAFPTNEAYFQGVVRTLSSLQQYDALLPIVESHATARESVEAAILAGSLRARRSERDAAIRWWDRALELGRDKEQTLVQISIEQRKAALYDLALATIRKVRERSGRPADFPYSDELIGLLTITGAYDEACDEIVSVFLSERDMYRAMRSITVLLASEGSAEPLTRAIDRLPKNSEEALRLKQWVFRQTRSWDRALSASAELDRAVRANGNELLMFADGARNDEQFEVALKAYDNVLDVSKDQRTLMSAAYGSVRALEQQMRRARELSAADAREIVRRYDDVISSYPNHPLCADALFNAARIEDGILGLSEKARERLQRIQNQWRGTTTFADAALLLASLYLAINKDAEAQAVLGSVIAASNVIAGDKQDVARLMLADMLLWSGKIAEARSGYTELADNPSSAAANDAIDRLLLLDIAQDDSVSVRSFAEAEGLFARRLYPRAYAAFMQIGESARDVDLRDRAWVKAIESAVAMRDDTLALRPAQNVLDRIPETIWGDRVLLRLAEIEERRGDVPAAMKALNALLVAYPRSIFVPAARDRIRRLRGDS